MIGRSAPEPAGRPRFAPSRPRRLVGLGLLLALILGAIAGPPRLARAQRPGPPTRPGGRPVAGPTEPPAELPAPADEPAPLGQPAPTPTPRRPAELPDRDERVIPASAEPGDEGGKELNMSIPKPNGDGAPAPAAAPSAGDPADSFALRSDRLSSGKQQVRLAVEVLAPKVLNLLKDETIRLVVTNQGSNDVHGVILAYQLPEGLEFVRNDAKEEVVNLKSSPQFYTWTKPMMAANADWTVSFRVKAKEARACEHLASVTAKVGTKERTMVQWPKLQVEAVVNPGRVLKGEQVNVQVTIHNPGTGPARDVTVTARLEDGLKLREAAEDQVEQVIPLLKPGETIQLDPLLVDTVAGGKHACVVEVASPDVNHDKDAHHASTTVEITEPKLEVHVSGQPERLTGQPIEFKVQVKNAGTAPAQAVVVSAYMPTQGGKLRGAPPSGGQFDGKDRKIIWRIPRLEAGEPVEYRFLYDTSTVGNYKCSVEAVSGPLRQSHSTTTDVTGYADLDLKVAQTARVIDVGGSTYYDFTIRNHGTKEATHVLVSGDLTNLKVKNQYSDNLAGEFGYNDKVSPATFSFPEIPKLAAGESITLSIEVVGLQPGQASATVMLAHGEPGKDDANRVKQSIFTRVTNNKPPGQ